MPTEGDSKRGSIAGRTFLVTGAGRRLGKAIAEGLTARGARVVRHAWSSMDSADTRIRNDSAATFAVHADLRDPLAPGAIFREIEAWKLDVEGVVHAASAFPRATFRETTLGLWDETHALEVRAFFLLAQALYQHRGMRGGTLIALSDTSAYGSWKNHFVHSVAKANILNLVRALAREMAPRYRVNAVVLGPVLPPDRTTPEEIVRMKQRTLLKRLGDPEDAVEAIVYLLAAPYVTASILDVHGGAPWWRDSGEEIEAGKDGIESSRPEFRDPGESS